MMNEESHRATHHARVYVVCVCMHYSTPGRHGGYIYTGLYILYALYVLYVLYLLYVLYIYTIYTPPPTRTPRSAQGRRRQVQARTQERDQGQDGEGGKTGRETERQRDGYARAHARTLHGVE